MRMNGLKDATRFSREVFLELKNTLDCSPSFIPDKDGEEDIAEILILSKGKIFSSGSQMDVLESSNFTAIGSGADFATGAMSVLYGNIKSESELREAVINSIIATCESSIYCALPMVIQELRW